MYISWVVLQMLKLPTKWKKLTTRWPWAHIPQTHWRLRIDNANPCDTALFPHHQPIRDLHTSWSPTLWLPFPYLALKNASLTPIREFGSFEHEPLHSPCRVAAANLSPFQTPMFCSLWPRGHEDGLDDIVTQNKCFIMWDHYKSYSNFERVKYTKMHIFPTPTWQTSRWMFILPGWDIDQTWQTLLSTRSNVINITQVGISAKVQESDTLLNMPAWAEVNIKSKH